MFIVNNWIVSSHICKAIFDTARQTIVETINIAEAEKQIRPPHDQRTATQLKTRIFANIFNILL